MSNRWKTLSPDAKKEFDALELEDKQRFKKEKALHKPPKGRSNRYILWLREKKKTVPRAPGEKGNIQIRQEWRDEWKVIKHAAVGEKVEERKYILDLKNKEIDRYVQQMIPYWKLLDDIWEAQTAEDTAERKKRWLKKKAKAAARKLSGGGRKRASPSKSRKGGSSRKRSSGTSSRSKKGGTTKRTTKPRKSKKASAAQDTPEAAPAQAEEKAEEEIVEEEGEAATTATEQPTLVTVTASVTAPPPAKAVTPDLIAKAGKAAPVTVTGAVTRRKVPPPSVNGPSAVPVS